MDETSKIFNQHLYNYTYINKLLSEDKLAFGYLGTLINDYPFIPFTGSSLRPFCLNHIINDIIINDRQDIVEFGSGISSILIGRLIKKNSLSTTLISIEHDLKWCKLINKILLKEGLDDVVKVCHAPLTNCALTLDGNEWYDTTVLDSNLKNKTYDMVIVDGPPAWEEVKYRSRFPALPYIINKLNIKHAIYLDDAVRPGEQSVISEWENKFSIKFEVTGDSLAYYYSGDSFYTEPYAYY